MSRCDEYLTSGDIFSLPPIGYSHDRTEKITKLNEKKTNKK